MSDWGGNCPYSEYIQSKLPMRFPIPTNSSPSLITKYSAGRDIY
jgi:hypothetical protein